MREVRKAEYKRRKAPGGSPQGESPLGVVVACGVMLWLRQQSRQSHPSGIECLCFTPEHLSL